MGESVLQFLQHTLSARSQLFYGKTPGLVASAPAPPWLPAGGHATPGVCTRAAAAPWAQGWGAPHACLGLDTHRRTGAARQGRRGGKAPIKVAGESWDDVPLGHDCHTLETRPNAPHHCARFDVLVGKQRETLSPERLPLLQFYGDQQGDRASRGQPRLAKNRM